MGEIFRTHDSAITHREENGLENGQDDRGGPALSEYTSREIADKVPIYEGDRSL